MNAEEKTLTWEDLERLPMFSNRGLKPHGIYLLDLKKGFDLPVSRLELIGKVIETREIPVMVVSVSKGKIFPVEFDLHPETWKFDGGYD